MDGGNKDDGCLLKARMLANHVRQLEAIQLWHADVHEYDGNVGLQKAFERVATGICPDEVLAELIEDSFIADQLTRLIIDHEDVDLVLVVQGGLWFAYDQFLHRYRCNHIRNAESNCSV